MADLSSTSIWVKVCLVLIPLGGLFHLIGFASPYWVNDGTNNSGLWRLCTNTVCIDFLHPGITLQGWLRATQFFETVGLIAIAAAAVLLFLSIFVQALKDKKIITIINALACFGACGTIIIGAIIYGSQDRPVAYLSWAFALCIVGAIMEGVAGALIILGTFAARRP
ncbi:uncharacterized protein LOC124291078 isoform X1 [Haliotis rubra]|uniref:uncharacterized protein LOC124291078 isoform X1 n=1 Tax=Haliotis rubra TaxID=36100 RepID=UPI001EE569FD|nr:uncharacterized protein LOC124291078 isoform X1 [Haliotis rubra]